MVGSRTGRVEIRSGANVSNVLHTFGQTFGTVPLAEPLGMASGESNGDGQSDFAIENRNSGNVELFGHAPQPQPGTIQQ